MLPVSQQKEEFLLALCGNRTLILVGETASGKTTLCQSVLQHVGVKLLLDARSDESLT
jgi:HrpA-like RNA helicase